MRIVHRWLQDFVAVPDDAEVVAREIGLRGFEVAGIDRNGLEVIDFEITANRPDCLSHAGIAREASTIWALPLKHPDSAELPREGAASVDVRLEDADLCPRYCAQVFEVAVGLSPDWLIDRLHAAGIRPINNIVDVTNYVMLEIGQPMHAFDLERLRDRTIVVRRARAGERLKTLDGVERSLDGEMLIIADAANPIALGGVMGGADSEIGAGTTRIALESANFHPPSVRRAGRRLGLKTEASIRFERGADIAAPPRGIARAASLLAQLGAGRPLGPLVDRYPAPRERTRVRLRASRIARLLGQEVPGEDVPRYLEPLGFGVEREGDEAGTSWIVTVPSFRIDVTREVDLIEEVGRHYGFDRLPVTFPALTGPQAPPDARIVQGQLARTVLAAGGFSEAVTFAFIEREAALPFCPPGHEPSRIANPLSEKFAVLRPSLLPGLLDACAHNRRRERRDVQLFETGSRFARGQEGRAAAFVWCGAAGDRHWSGGARTVDFFDAKGVVEEICAAFGVTPEFGPAVLPYLVEGRAAGIRAAGNGSAVLGVLGQLAPEIADARGFPPAEEVYGAEIDMDVLGALAPADDLRVESLPRFPSIVRDVSIVVDEALPAAAVRGTIRSAAPPVLVSVEEFDRYQGQGVPQGRVSLSLRLTFRAADRTLTDAEAESATTTIVDALRREHGAERR